MNIKPTRTHLNLHVFHGFETMDHPNFLNATMGSIVMHQGTTYVKAWQNPSEKNVIAYRCPVHLDAFKDILTIQRLEAFYIKVSGSQWLQTDKMNTKHMYVENPLLASPLTLKHAIDLLLYFNNDHHVYTFDAIVQEGAEANKRMLKQRYHVALYNALLKIDEKYAKSPLLEKNFGFYYDADTPVERAVPMLIDLCNSENPSKKKTAKAT